MIGSLAARTAWIAWTAWIAALGFAGACCTPMQAQAEASGADLTRSLRAVFDRHVPEGGWGAALVARGGVELLAAGRGADGSGTPMGIDAIVDIGSVSKSFTAAGILRLQMQGKLALSDPLSRFVPDVPEDKRGITLLHLLTHTSGIAADADIGTGPATSADLLAHVLAAPLAGPPGPVFRYSNANYFVLAVVIERASGESFETWMAREVFAAAGLQDTGLVGTPPAVARGRFARRIGRVEGRTMDTALDEYPWNWAQRGATGVLTSLRDLQRWHVAVTRGPLLDPVARALTRTPLVGGYACGWQVDATRLPVVVLEHGGRTGGFCAYLISVASDDLCIAVTAREDTDVAALAHALLAEVMPAGPTSAKGSPRTADPAARAPAPPSEPAVRGNIRIAANSAGTSDADTIRDWPLWEVRRLTGDADFLYCTIFAREDGQLTCVADLYLPLDIARSLAADLRGAGVASEVATPEAPSGMALTFPAPTDAEKQNLATLTRGWQWRALEPPLELAVLPASNGATDDVRVEFTSRGTRVLSLQLSRAAAREWARRIADPKAPATR